MSESLSKIKQFKPKPDPVLLKLLPDVHPLSTEEQIFFMQITENVFGLNEQLRNETFRMIAVDYNITKIARYLCIFIKETIETNIVFPDLTLLIYTVRMSKSLIANNYVDLREDIHYLLPAVLSCVLAKKISRYYYNNHWILRDFSTYVVTMICHLYDTTLNNIKQRVINLYVKPIQELAPLTTIYGAIKGLSCFGEETIKNYLLPNIVFITTNLAVENTKCEQRILEEKHVNDLLILIVSPMLCKNQNVNYIQPFWKY